MDGKDFPHQIIRDRMRHAGHPGAHPGTGESKGAGKLFPPGAGGSSRGPTPSIRSGEKEWPNSRVVPNTQNANICILITLPGRSYTRHSSRRSATAATKDWRYHECGDAFLHYCYHYILCLHNNEGNRTLYSLTDESSSSTLEFEGYV